MTILSLVRRSAIIKEVTIGLLLVALFCSALPTAHAEPPSWWSTRGVINPQREADDFAVLNHGQLKKLAAEAIEEMNVRLPNGAGVLLNALLQGWRNQTASADDYSTVNLGQLKKVVAPIYARLISEEIAHQLPWANSPNPADDFAAVNIGQAKMVFNFAIMMVRLPENWRDHPAMVTPGDMDADGLSDAWETANGLSVGWDDSGFDYDFDGLSNRQEQLNGLNPNSHDEFGVRFYFRWRHGEAWAEGFGPLTENPQDQPAMLFATKTITLLDEVTDTRTTSTNSSFGDSEWSSQSQESIDYEFTYTLTEAMKGTIWTSSTGEERDPVHQTYSTLTASISFAHGLASSSEEHSSVDSGSYTIGEDHYYFRSYYLGGQDSWNQEGDGPIGIDSTTFLYTKSGHDNRYWHGQYWRTGLGAYQDPYVNSNEQTLNFESAPGFSSYYVEKSDWETYETAAFSETTQDYHADSGAKVGSYSYTVELSDPIFFEDVITAFEEDLEDAEWSEWVYAETPDQMRMIDAYFTATNGGSSMYAVTWVAEYYVEFVTPSGGPLIGVEPASLSWMEVTTPYDGSKVRLDSQSAVLQPGQRTQVYKLDPTSFVSAGGAFMNLAWLGTEGYADPLGRAPVRLSNPSPVVNVQQMEMSSVYRSDEGALLGRLRVKGTVTSELCDTLPGETGVIRHVGVFMNHNSSPDAVIPLKVTKQPVDTPDLSDGDRPFPYLGEFDVELEDVPVTEGVNNIRVVAADSVYVDEGHSEWSTTVTPLFPPPVGGGGGEDPPPGPPVVPSSLDFTLSSPVLNSENQDTLTLRGKWRGRTVQQVSLAETGPDTRQFHSADGLLRVNLHLDGNLSQEVGDRFAVTVADDVSGPVEIHFNVTETGANTGRFVAGEAAALLGGQPGGGGQNGVGDGESEEQDENEGEDAESQAYAYSVGAVVSVSQSLGGAFHPVRIYGYGFPNDTEVTIGSGENAISGTLKVGDPNTGGIAVVYHKNVDAHMIMTQRPGLTVDTFQKALPPGITADLWEHYEFGTGYIMGFKDGATEMVTGSLESGLGVAKSVANMHWAQAWSVKIVVKSALGMDTEEDVMIHQHFVDTATGPAQEMIAWIALAHKSLFHFIGQQNAIEFALIKGYLTDDERMMSAAAAEKAQLYALVYVVGAELLAYSMHALANKSPHEKGKVYGRIMFEIIVAALEIAAAFVPGGQAAAATKLSRLAKLQKLKILEKVLGNGKSILNSPDYPELADVLTRMRRLLFRMRTTKMCFVAGTLVLTSNGLLPIEQVHAGETVWARDEFTRVEGWRPVLQTFVTHPTELWHVSIDANADGIEDEAISGTGEHPFWVEEREEFVPARELQAGWHLSLADSKAPPVCIVRLERERAPPGQLFTTYNFEVDEFHTYFVGRSGVWVHNFSAKFCEEFFSLIEAIRERLGIAENAVFTKRFRLLEEAWKHERQAGRIVSAVDGNQAMHVSQMEEFADYAGKFPAHTQDNPVGELASFKKQKSLRESQAAGGKFGAGGYEIHHTSERRISEAVGLPPGVWDDSPGIALPARPGTSQFDAVAYKQKFGHDPIYHQGMGGIKGEIDKIMTGMQGELVTDVAKQALLNTVRDLYTRPPYDKVNMWPVTRDWLRKQLTAAGKNPDIVPQ
jgi:hypothetical protein